jgi:hypothetical protein
MTSMLHVHSSHFIISSNNTASVSDKLTQFVFSYAQGTITWPLCVRVDNKITQCALSLTELDVALESVGWVKGAHRYLHWIHNILLEEISVQSQFKSFCQHYRSFTVLWVYHMKIFWRDERTGYQGTGCGQSVKDVEGLIYWGKWGGGGCALWYEWKVQHQKACVTLYTSSMHCKTRKDNCYNHYRGQWWKER